MIAAELSSFEAPQLAAQLNCMSDAELDALPFGVIEMNHQFKVLRYNATKSRYSGLASDRAIGQHFFRDVAPWATIVVWRNDTSSTRWTRPLTTHSRCT
jgi:photoactive yellow protein